MGPTKEGGENMKQKGGYENPRRLNMQAYGRGGEGEACQTKRKTEKRDKYWNESGTLGKGRKDREIKNELRRGK